ncbi:uncharacterized protein LOC135835413 [Planococcus citri]|uniref:uncharacterized protein LOC135835413 n=1 Tax=Planococcus citri TaxID=170843 RepID=UPI0031F93F66
MAKKRVRTTDRKPFTAKQLENAKKLLAEGCSLRGAATKLGVKESTMRRHIRSNSTSESLGRFRKAFEDSQEKEIAQFIKDLDENFGGIPKCKLGPLIYRFAEKKGIEHRFSSAKKSVGRDWIDSFLSRHNISLRTPPKTSADGVKHFNQEEVNLFFENYVALKELLDSVVKECAQVGDMDKSGSSSAVSKSRGNTIGQRNKRRRVEQVSLDAVDDEYEQSFDNEEFLETQDSPHDLLTVSFQACDDESYTNHQIKEESKDEDSETEIASRCSAPFEDEPASSTAHSLTFSNLVAEVGTPRSYFSTNKSPVSSSNAPFESSTFRRTSSDQNKNSFRGGVVDTSLGQMDEFDIFGKNVGIQLKQLPLENALELQAKIHQLIIAERLKVIRQNKKNGLIIEDNDDAEDDSDL